MNAEKIKTDIKKLREDLSGVSEVDGEVLKRLELLDQEIHALLDKSKTTEVQNQESTTDEMDSLTALATELTNQHPKAGQTLREIAYALGRMGI